MPNAPTLPVTQRHLPPSDERSLLRWLDRRRSKFGQAKWFNSAEAHLQQQEAEQAYQLLREGVEGEIARTVVAEAQAREVPELKITPPRIVFTSRPADWAAPSRPAPRRAPPERKSKLTFDKAPAAKEPDPTPGEMLAASVVYLASTRSGQAGLGISLAAAVAATVAGYGAWVGLALLDVAVAAVLLLYPFFILFAVSGLIGDEANGGFGHQRELEASAVNLITLKVASNASAPTICT